MHVSHLLSVPLLALVVVFLISQVKLTVQIDESEVALDVSDPRLLVALSFIIAARPWAMLNFVREAGSRFFSQILSRITSGVQTQRQQENV
jgi:flagellar biosynthesis protein FliQ